MLKLLSANKIRIKKSKLFWTGLFLITGYSVFLLIMNYIEMAPYIGNSIVPLNWFLLSPFSVISFFCPVFTSIFIGTDYSDGTIRNRLIVGHTRKNIYLANFISICSVNIVITLIASAVIILLGIFMFGWYIVNPMLFTVYYLSGIMMIIAFASFFTSVSMIIHSKTISAVTCIIAFLISCIVEGIVQRLVFCHYNGEQISDVFSNLSEDMVSQPLLEFLYDFIPTGQCFQITRDIALHPLKLPIYSAVFTIITVVCGVLAFNQKDIK